MRLSTLYIASLALFFNFVNLSKTPKGSNNKRDRDAFSSNEQTSEPTISTRKVRTPRSSSGAGGSFATTFFESSSSSSSSKVSSDVVVVNKDELLSVLLTGKQNSIFNGKVDAIGPSNMPADIAHELMISCMHNKKEANLKHMLSTGFRFNFTEEKIKDDVNALIQAIVDEKVDFLSLFLDVDPIGATRLLVAAHNSSPHSKIIETLKNCLKKNGSTIDSGAIQLAADKAADLQSIPIFRVFFESDLMIAMISRSKLLKLFSVNAQSSQVHEYPSLLDNINCERRLTLPYEMSLLSAAAAEGNMEFLRTVEPYLGFFPWDVAIQAITIALKKVDYNFVDILLRTNNYAKVDFLFRLVPETVFVDIVGKFANTEIIDKLVNATCRDGKNLVLVDLNLMRICMRAAEHGNIEVIDYFLIKQYFDLNTRFKFKSIFRIAVENGRSDLVKFLIKVHGYNINDSDTPQVNPVQNGGDSLIYTARDSHADLFLYLLRLGANRNAQVNHEGKELNLIYWCMLKGQTEIVNHLLNFGCEFDPAVALRVGVKPEQVSIALSKIKQSK